MRKADLLPDWVSRKLALVLIDKLFEATRGDVDNVIGVPVGIFRRSDHFDFFQRGISVREFKWLPADKKALRTVFGMDDAMGGGLTRSAHYIRPVDAAGGYDFLDCDVWRLWGVPNVGAVSPLRPLEICYLGDNGLAWGLSRDWSTDEDGPAVRALRSKLLTYRLSQKVVASSNSWARKCAGLYGVSLARTWVAPNFGLAESSGSKLGKRVRLLKVGDHADDGAQYTLDLAATVAAIEARVKVGAGGGG